MGALTGWALASCVAASALAAPPSAPRAGEGDLRVRLLAVDFPFTALHGGEFPSMQQSLLLTGDLAQLAHHSAFRALAPLDPPWGRWARFGAVAAIDLVGFTWADVWMHEEWHRAVLTVHGIPSFNDALTLTLRNGGISVSHVADADLVRLKAESNPDMVRLMEAGMEAELELVRRFRKTSFSDGLDALPGVMAAWYASVSVLGYRQTCASAEADALTDEFNATEGGDVAIRDFTGLDCTAWIYDLDRPGEPYAARGVHPSGVGIDRYIRYSDLSALEQGYLRKVRTMGLLNLAAPYLFGFSRFTSASPFDGKPFQWSVALVHHLTAYGQELSLDVLLGRAPWNLFASYHHGMNLRGGFPGLELEVARYPLFYEGQRFELTAGAMAWLQPEGLAFHADKARPGGLLRALIELPASEHVRPFFELEAKTEGWVAGNVYTGPAVSFRGGVTLVP